MLSDLYDLTTAQLKTRRSSLLSKIAKTRNLSKRYELQDEFDFIARVLKTRIQSVLES